MSGQWHIGVIGGSGLAAGLALDDSQVIEVTSPFGLPSAAITTGTLAGVRSPSCRAMAKGMPFRPRRSITAPTSTCSNAPASPT